MTITYALKTADSDLDLGGLFDKVLSTGTETASTIEVSLPGSATLYGYGHTVANSPGSGGCTGNYTVELYVTTKNSAIYASVTLVRELYDGTTATTGTTTSEQALSSTGLYTFTFTAENLGTWGSTDRLRVRYNFRNSLSASKDCTIRTGTTDTEVITPYTAIYLQSCTDALALSETKTTQSALNRTITDVSVLASTVSKLDSKSFNEALSLTDVTVATSKITNKFVTEGNLVSDFESGNYAPIWTPTGTWTIQSSVKHSGTYSARGDTDGLLQTTISGYPAGGKYSAWLYVDSVTALRQAFFTVQAVFEGTANVGSIGLKSSEIKYSAGSWTSFSPVITPTATTWYKLELVYVNDAATCDFNVYNAAGTLLGSALGITPAKVGTVTYIRAEEYGVTAYYDDITYSGTGTELILSTTVSKTISKTLTDSISLTDTVTRSPITQYLTLQAYSSGFEGKDFNNPTWVSVPGNPARAQESIQGSIVHSGNYAYQLHSTDTNSSDYWYRTTDIAGTVTNGTFTFSGWLRKTGYDDDTPSAYDVAYLILKSSSDVTIFSFGAIDDKFYTWYYDGHDTRQAYASWTATEWYRYQVTYVANGTNVVSATFKVHNAALAEIYSQDVTLDASAPLPSKITFVSWTSRLGTSSTDFYWDDIIYGYGAHVLQDTATKTTIKVLSETISLSEAITKNQIAGRSFTDSLSLSETLSKLTSKPKSDSIVLTDTQTKLTTKLVAETAHSLTEGTVTAIKTAIRSFSDSLVLSEAILKTMSKLKAETAHLLVETISKSNSRAISETAHVLSTTLAKLDSKPIIETAHVLSDPTLTKTAIKVLSSSLALSESLSKTGSKLSSETAHLLSEALTKSEARSISETAHILNESLLKETLVPISDSLSLSESVSTYVPISGVHYQLELDKTSTAWGDLELDLDTSISVTNWEYYDGAEWKSFPVGGMSVAYEGNKVRYNASGLTTGTKYWRVREKDGIWDDTGWFVVSGGAVKEQTCTETLILSEEVSKTVSKVLTDSLSLSETLSKYTDKELVDSLILVEARSTQSSFYRTISDTLVLVETVTKVSNKALSSTLVLDDAINKGPAKALIETLIILDVGTRVPNKILTSSITLAESLSVKVVGKDLLDILEILDGDWKQALTIYQDNLFLYETVQSISSLQRTFSDALVLEEAISKGRQKDLSDALVLVDSPPFTLQRTLSETLSLSDSLSNLSQKTLSETLIEYEILTATSGLQVICLDLEALIESLNKSLSKTVTDSLILSDTKTSTSSKTLTETLVLSEENLKQTSKSLLETLVLTDSVSMQTIKECSDSLVLIESLIVSSTGLKTITVSDALVLVEAPMRDVSKVLIETLVLNEAVFTGRAITLSDSIILTEALTNYASKVLTEILVLVERVYIPLNIPLSDTLILFESLTKTTSIILTENLSLIEYLTKFTSKAFLDSENLIEGISKTTSKPLIETDILSDSLIRGRVLGETLGLGEITIKDSNKGINEPLILQEIFSTTAILGRSFSDTLILDDVFSRLLCYVKASKDIYLENTNLNAIIEPTDFTIYSQNLNANAISRTLDVNATIKTFTYNAVIG